MRRHHWFFLITCLLLVILSWWWVKQAPYRVAKKFLIALQSGDIQTLYELSDPYERNLIKLKPENFRAAYDIFFRNFFQSWYFEEIRPHISMRRFILTLSSHNHYPFVVTFKNEKGQFYKSLIVPRWTEDKWSVFYGRWRVSFGNFVYFFHMQSQPISRQLAVLKGLLKSGFYAFPTETGLIYNVPVGIEMLEAEIALEKAKGSQGTR